MAKTINFEFWKLTIIDKENDKTIPFKDVIAEIEKKPLKLSEDEHRYYCNNQLCYRAISHIDRLHNGKIITFSKYENDNIKGGYLEDGAGEFDAIAELKKAINRDDVAIKEYNRVKIYSNGIVIFQINTKANTMNQLKDYLKHHCTKDYEIEIVRVYQNNLFEMIDNGNIEQMSITVGFAPDNSFDAFLAEDNTGAATVEIKLKKPKDGYLKSKYLKSVLHLKKLANFGILDGGMITNAKATIKDKDSQKRMKVSLDEYQLKESKILQDTTFYDMQPHKVFDEIYDKHKDFLEDYVTRDTRYTNE